MVELSMRITDEARWKTVKIDEDSIVDEIIDFAQKHDVDEVKIKLKATAILKTKVKGLGALFG